MALVGQLSGSARSASAIGITGSVVVANRPAGSFPAMPGTDVVFFVSGSSFGGTEMSSFGGDLVVSGSIISYGDFMEVTGTLSVTNGISGSLTKLSNGTSYLIAGTNIAIVTGSGGAVTITNTLVPPPPPDDFFDSTTAGSVFTTGSFAFRGQEAIDSPSDKGTDVFFYISGSVSGSGAEDKKTLFGGDVVVSGTTLFQNNVALTADFLEVTGTIASTFGISGSLTRLHNGQSYLIAGPGITINSASNGSVYVSGSWSKDLQFLAGTLTSAAVSGTFESVGMAYFNPADFPTGTRTVTFSAILAPTAGTTAYMDLYDYNSVVSLLPDHVSGSVLTGSSVSYTHVSKEITNMASISSAGIIEARIWCTPNGSGLNAVCKSAKLEVKVS